MRKGTSQGRSRAAYAGTLVISLLTIAVLGTLAPLLEAAKADDLTRSAEAALVAETTSDDAVRTRLSDAYGKLPLYFEVNQGQTDLKVKFLSRSPKHTLFLTSREAVLVFMMRENRAEDEKRATKGTLKRPAKVAALRMTFVGAQSDVQVTGREALLECSPFRLLTAGT